MTSASIRDSSRLSTGQERFTDGVIILISAEGDTLETSGKLLSAHSTVIRDFISLASLDRNGHRQIELPSASTTGLRACLDFLETAEEDDFFVRLYTARMVMDRLGLDAVMQALIVADAYDIPAVNELVGQRYQAYRSQPWFFFAFACVNDGISTYKQAAPLTLLHHVTTMPHFVRFYLESAWPERLEAVLRLHEDRYAVVEAMRRSFFLDRGMTEDKNVETDSGREAGEHETSCKGSRKTRAETAVRVIEMLLQSDFTSRYTDTDHMSILLGRLVVCHVCRSNLSSIYALALQSEVGTAFLSGSNIIP